MAKFQHKNKGICEVFSRENIEKLRKNPNYKEIIPKVKEELKNKSTELQDSQDNQENKENKENKEK